MGWKVISTVTTKSRRQTPKPTRRQALKAGATTALLATVPATTWAAAGAVPLASSPPITLRVSERVAAGEVLTFFGEGFDPDPAGNTVLLQPLRGSTIPSGPGPEAVTVPVLQADPGGHFIRVVLPFADPAAAWVRTHAGLGSTVLVNAPQPRWLAVDEAYPGMPVYLIGRNLDPRGIGLRGRTEVRLVSRTNPARAMPVGVKELSSYHLVFHAPELDPGPYDVQVRTTDDMPWTTAPDTLTMVPAGPHVDPLRLGVAWTRDFAWHNVHDVREYGARGDGATDDTAAIQRGIDTIADQGGGVLFFPPGTYNHDALQLRAGVILRGASNQASVLQYTGTGGNVFTSKGDGITDGHGGVCDLKFVIQAPDRLTSRYSLFVLGTPWGQFPTPGSGRFFVYRTVQETPLDNPHVLVSVLGFDQKVLLAENHWTGRAPQFFSPYLREYIVLRDNVFDYAAADGALPGQRRGLILRNTFRGHYIPGLSGNFRGPGLASGRGLESPRHFYFQGNTVSGMGSHDNDGESYAFQDTYGTFFYGSVLAATPTTATVSVDYVDMVNGGQFGWQVRWQIVIVQGRGLGQMRDIVDHVDVGNTRILTVSEPWTVVPDATSRYTVIRTMSDIVCEENLAVDCEALFMFYHNVYDSVCAGLVSRNTGGVSVWGRAMTQRREPTYFNVVRDCSLSGKAPFFGDTVMLVTAAQPIPPRQPAVAVMAYGTEFRSNAIDRSACADSHSLHYGHESPSAIEASLRHDGPITGGQGILATLIEKNSIRNSAVGVYLNTGVDSTLVFKNRYENVGQAVVQSGSTNTLVVTE